MPLVFTHKGHRFFFFSNEGDPREPIHIHVKKGDALAKFWIKPEVSVAEAYGFNAKELNRLARLILTRKYEIEEAWNEHFTS